MVYSSNASFFSLASGLIKHSFPSLSSMAAIRALPMAIDQNFLLEEMGSSMNLALDIVFPVFDCSLKYGSMLSTLSGVKPVVGRPKLFDDSQVLTAAMSVFWKNGYKGTSTAELCKATGLKPGSIYHRYDDKESLFCRSLEFYIEGIVDVRIADMVAYDKPVAGIEHFFASAYDSVPSRELLGCLLTNTVLEDGVGTSAVRKIVDRGLNKIESAFRVQIADAVERGDLAQSTDVADTAIYLISCFQGLMTSSRLTKNKKRLRTVTRQAMLRLHTSG